jgi:hypothetical protein
VQTSALLHVHGHASQTRSKDGHTVYTGGPLAIKGLDGVSPLMDLRPRIGSFEYSEVHGRVRWPPRCADAASSSTAIVYLAPSRLPGAGLGVFARVDIPSGAVVTPYDGPLFYGHIDCSGADGLRVSSYALVVPDRYCCAGAGAGAPEADGGRRRSARLLLHAGRMHATREWQVLGEWGGASARRSLTGGLHCVRGGAERCGWRRGAPRGLGHLLNDALHPSVTGRDNNCEFAFRGQASGSRSGRAVAFLRATRPIGAGEELYVSYHVSYWAGRQLGPAAPAHLGTFCAELGLLWRAFRAAKLTIDELLDTSYELPKCSIPDAPPLRLWRVRVVGRPRAHRDGEQLSAFVAVADPATQRWHCLTCARICEGTMGCQNSSVQS